MNLNNNYLLFFTITILSSIVILLSTNLLNTEELTYNFYAEQLAKEQVEQLIENQQKWWWVSYTIIPFVVLIRSSLVAICLSVGLFFYYTEDKTKFNDLVNITLKGEFVLVTVGFAKLFYFLVIKTNYTFEDLQQYYPLSYINFLDIKSLEPWLLYPLQTINLFEIGYFFALVYGLHKLLKNNYWRSFEITAASYGTGLAIWLGLVAFLTLSIA